MVGKPCNDETNERVELLLKCGVPPKEISETTGLSISQIYRKKGKLKAFGTVNPAPLSVRGRPRLLTREHEEAIEDFMDEYPQAYLDEVIAFLWDEFDIEVSHNTVDRVLHRIQLTYKKAEHVSSAQEVELRIRWRVKLCDYTAEQMVFLDETACSGRTQNRRWGWSPRGFPCRVRRMNSTSKRWSILPALSKDGYIAVDMFQGSYNAERFESFVACHVLPRMNPWPLPRSVLVVDNVSTHRPEVILPFYRYFYEKH
jgi:transposase